MKYSKINKEVGKLNKNKSKRFNRALKKYYKKRLKQARREKHKIGIEVSLMMIGKINKILNNKN